MAIELKGLFSPKEAAKILGVSRMTIFRWLKAGRLAPVVVAGQRFIPESETDRLKKEKQGGNAKE